MKNISSEVQVEYCTNRLSGVPDDLIISAALEILEKRVKSADMEAMESPEQMAQFLRLRLYDYEYEVFGVVLLDNRHRVIEMSDLFRGTADGASIFDREVVKEALQHNAAAVIFYHNHPSGMTQPSQADIQTTLRLKKALTLVDVRVLDHFIVGLEGHTSLAERGVI